MDPKISCASELSFKNELSVTASDKLVRSRSRSRSRSSSLVTVCVWVALWGWYFSRWDRNNFEKRSCMISFLEIGAGSNATSRACRAVVCCFWRYDFCVIANISYLTFVSIDRRIA